MKKDTRRTFLKRSGTAVAVGASGVLRAAGANDRLVVALIGCGGQGPGVAGAVKGAGNVFYGTKGWMYLTKRGACKIYDERNKEIEIPGDQPSMEDHRTNFVRSIREGARPGTG